MLEFAAHTFKLGQSDSKGVTYRANLEQVYKATGRMPDDLIEPDFPSQLAHIWGDFIKMNESRGAGVSGPAPLSFNDMLNYQKIYDIKLTAFEIDVIRRIDKVYFEAIAEARKNG